MAFLALGWAFACGDRGDGGAAPPPSSAAAPLLVPAAPDDLAAHVVVQAARSSLPALRAGLGDAAAAIPGSFASVVTSLAGLPITVAELVEDDAPITASILATESGIEAVVAVHVRSTDRLASIATAGEGARFRAIAGDAGLTRLVPVRPPSEGAAAPHLAVLGNHLLIGTSDAAIDRAGAFTERAPPPALEEGELIAIEHGPAAPILARRLAARWLGPASTPSTPGAPPVGPHGDLGAALALGPYLLPKLDAAFDALAGGRTSLRLDGGRVRIDVAAGDSLLTRLGAASLPASEAVSFLALPKDAAVAVLFHGGGAGTQAVTLSSELTSLTGISGPRREKVAAAITKLEHARAPALALGAGMAPGGPALWFRTPVVDGPGAKGALAALVKAVGEKAKKERPSVTARATVVERVGDVVRLRVRDSAREDAAPVDVYLRREDDLLLGATGRDAIEALQALRDGAPESRLGSEQLAVDLAASAPKHYALGLVDLVGIDALMGRKPTGAARVLAGASLAERGGVLSVRILLEPAALPALREKLKLP